MKIQCHLCKEIVEIGAFNVADDGINIQCRSCEQSFFLTATGRAKASQAETQIPKKAETSSANESDLSDDEPSGATNKPCPKCGEPVDRSAEACCDCGLMRTRFAQFAADAAESDPVLENLWKDCLDNWNDPDAHDSFAAHASQLGSFAQAARRYREYGKAHSGNPVATEVATTRLARITKMAEVSLLAKRPVATDELGGGHYRGVVILLVFMLLVGVAAGVYTLTKKSASSTNGKSTPVTRPAR